MHSVRKHYLKLSRLKKKRKKLARQLRLYNNEIDASLPLQDIDRDIGRQQEILEPSVCRVSEL